MTPQERQLVTELFDRLARLESSPRDAEAERAIADGARLAPHSLYALVQTVLVQDEALKRADARIRELGGEDSAPASGGFLDTMRNALTGRGSVPSVRASASDNRWNTGGALPPGAQAAAPAAAPAPAPGVGGGSFLGTAAATAAGVIGGSLLFSSIGSLFGGGQHSGSAFGNTRDNDPSGSPWDNNSSGGDLSRDAGVNDIGGNRSAGLFDNGNDSNADTGSNFGGGDFGGGGDGGD
jgi:uncharacterized protein